MRRGEPIPEITGNSNASNSYGISQNNHSPSVSPDPAALSTNSRGGPESTLSVGEPVTSTTVREHNFVVRHSKRLENLGRMEPEPEDQDREGEEEYLHPTHSRPSKNLQKYQDGTDSDYLAVPRFSKILSVKLRLAL